MQSMHAILPPGRVPDPPRRTRGSAAIGIAVFVLLGGGLLGAGIAASNAALGVLGKLVLGACALLGVLMAGSSLLQDRLRPGRELCWCPVVPGQRFSLNFVAHSARYHGVWLALDMSFPVEARRFRVVTSLHVVASGRVVFGDEVVTAWGIDPRGTDDVGHSSIASSAPRAGARSPMLPAVVELDRTVTVDGALRHPRHEASQSHPRSGALHTWSLLCKLTDLVPGESVDVLGTVHSPDFPTSMRAHAWVAVPRRPWWRAADR